MPFLKKKWTNNWTDETVFYCKIFFDFGQLRSDI